MYIQSYQIHNVLNVYRKQLSQGKNPGQVPTLEAKQKSFNVTISEEGKRKSVIDKVANNIVNKISRFGSTDNAQTIGLETQSKHLDGNAKAGPSKEKEFTFNVIDQNNQKVTSSISVEDSSVLVSRLEQLAQNAVNKKIKE